jgi:1,4-alpha-glucan branching enzyme
MAMAVVPVSSGNRLYDVRGAHVEQGGTRFSVGAPHAKAVTLVLTAFGREEHRLPMQRDEDGSWSVFTPLAKEGRTYRYHVDGYNGALVYRTDPFSTSIAQIDNRMESRVANVDSYVWGDKQWMDQRAVSNPLEQPLSIYELYPQCWKKQGGQSLNFRTLAPLLVDYCKKMHFSHVELYAILDNVGGWGYQVLNFFAPNHAQGGGSDFQFLVDQLHQNNIGVILDWIPAHYKHTWLDVSLHQFDGTNLFAAGYSEWGTAFFDFSKKEVREFLKSSLHYWLDKMHVDMIRVDAVSHMVYRGNKRYEPGIEFLKELNQSVKEDFPGVLMIAEDTTNFPHLLTPVARGGIGFDVKWNFHSSKQMCNFLKTPPQERPSHHEEKFMGHLRHLKWGDKVLFTYSHDEQCNRDYKNGYPVERDQTLFRLGTLQSPAEKFADMRNFFAWQVLSPHRGYLIHMGDEIGQKRSWDAGIWNPEGAIQWHLLDPAKEPDSAYHQGLQTCVSDLNKLYCSIDAFWKKGEQGFRLCTDHPVNNVIAYERSVKPTEGVLIVHNFSSGNWKKYDISLGNRSLFLSQGDKLEEIFNSNRVKYGGDDKHLNLALSVERGNDLFVSLELPPLSTLVFRKTLKRD